MMSPDLPPSGVQVVAYPDDAAVITIVLLVCGVIRHDHAVLKKTIVDGRSWQALRLVLFTCYFSSHSSVR
jgi:hypothetical protein